MAVSAFFAADAQTLVHGDKVLNIGLGFGTYNISRATFPPLSASFDYVIKDRLFDNKSAITVGGYAGYYAYKSEYKKGGNIYGWKYNNFILGARGALHYEFVKNLDTYVGGLLGYEVASSSYYSTLSYENEERNPNSVGGPVFSTYLGARYYFSPNFAAFAEVGYGLSALELGVAIKL